ncbi:unnamed protein product [Discula destructiva]
MTDNTETSHNPRATIPQEKSPDSSTSSANPKSVETTTNAQCSEPETGAERQSIRRSQYAENIPNPPPQFLDRDEQAPEVASNQDELKEAGEVDSFMGVPVMGPPRTESRVEPDVADPRGPAVVFAGSKNFGLHRKLIYGGIILLIVALVGAVIGAWFGTRPKNDGQSQAA